MCPQKQTLTQGFGGKSFIWEMVPGSKGLGSKTKKEPIQGAFLSRLPPRVTTKDNCGPITSGLLGNTVEHSQHCSTWDQLCPHLVRAAPRGLSHPFTPTTLICTAPPLGRENPGSHSHGGKLPESDPQIIYRGDRGELP